MDGSRIQMRLGGPEEVLDLVMKRTGLEHQQRIVVKGRPIGIESLEDLFPFVLPENREVVAICDNDSFLPEGLQEAGYAFTFGINRNTVGGRPFLP